MRQLLLCLLSVFYCHSLNASTCFGTTSNGRLEGACRLPSFGKNYTSYSSLLWLAGRTYIHCDVKDVLLNSYEALLLINADWVFVYGETGKQRGGRFKPHKTHQNGLSVDFMVPVIDRRGRSVPLPTNALNKYGYNIDFSLDGQYKELFIDYEAMAAHLAALKQSASSQGVDIWRVLFDPKMQGALEHTKAWPQISDLNFSKKRSWVRHDDHYHVDFIIPCKEL